MKKFKNLFSVALAGRFFGTGKMKRFQIPCNESVAIPAAELDLYVGIYASEDLKMKITVTKNESGNSLVVQSSDKKAFPLFAMSRNVFNHSTAGMVMEFLPENNKFALVQCNGCYPFIKEC